MLRLGTSARARPDGPGTAAVEVSDCVQPVAAPTLRAERRWAARLGGGADSVPLLSGASSMAATPPPGLEVAGHARLVASLPEALLVEVGRLLLRCPGPCHR